MQYRNISLSKNDTSALKGIALILLLCHHCWYTGKGYDDYIINGIPIFMKIGIFSKVCVSIFVFLSGYGLTEGCILKGGLGSTLHFYRRRLSKLMINYWFIYLLFVPIGIIAFNRTFPIVYGNDYLIKVVVVFIGLYNAIYGTPFGYNATWWFYSCIIFLYLLYPLIWKSRRYWYLLIPFCFIFWTISYRIPILRWSSCDKYILAFVCGMSLSYLKPKIGLKMGIMKKALLSFLLLFICLCRFTSNYPILWDTAITLFFIVVYVTIKLPKSIRVTLEFLGYHSWNIFLFHTFINTYYGYSFIRWSNNPILIWLTLLLICIIISICIENIKSLLYINKLQSLLSGN